MSERTEESLKARVRETPLIERLNESRKRIAAMCSERRGPKMTIPVEHYDDDFFICTTLEDARDEVARLRGIMEEAASAPGKDWLEWQLKLGAALTPQGKGQQVLKSGQSQEISSYAEGKGGGA